MKKKLKSFYLIIPLAVFIIFLILCFLTPFSLLEERVYDQLLNIKPPIPENKSLLFLEVDDSSIAKIGTWPWSRDKMAEGLLVLKEFGATKAVFDIEYTEKSPLGIDYSVLKTDIPNSIKKEFSNINDNTVDLFTALKQKQITLKQTDGYLLDLKDLNLEAQKNILTTVNSIIKDNDEYLGKAAGVFGQATFTVNMLPEQENQGDKALKDDTVKKWSYKSIQVHNGYSLKAKDIRPSVWPILSRAGTAGFPSVYIDADGVRRRIALVYEYQGQYFLQLGFSALIKQLGNPKIEVFKDHINLEKARMPSGDYKNITIPLDSDSYMLINWPPKRFINSFRHLSFYQLLLQGELEKALLANLQIMQESGYFSYYTPVDFMSEYKSIEKSRNKLLDSFDEIEYQTFIKNKENLFSRISSFLTGDTEEKVLLDVDTALKTVGISNEQKADFQATRQEVVKIFKATRELSSELQSLRQRLRNELKGSFCFIGNTATSTTDMGVNPFEKQYINLGTHASVVNTILNQQFLQQLPWGYSLIFGGILAFSLALLLRNRKPLVVILIGLAMVILLIIADILLFIISGVYVALLTPSLMVFITFLGLAMIQFLVEEKEKSFYRNAFSHYLSTDVINDIIANPDKLRLGGEKKYLTALFTDIKGFSSISETLDPADLVKLLNIYLTEMSDIILDLKGTIDKYEGDAIIAFFGAPLDLKDHAKRACLAAIRMKRIESDLNKQFIKESLSPNPLFSRVGINTGDMIVGNMGTIKKMDYTIMGNSVNLASRLEGVNKQYGTWILAGENTQEALGEGFLVRKLDRVRVVGITTPIRIYQIMEEKNEASSDQKDIVGLFHEAIDLFESKDWQKAKSVFEKILKIDPNDGPTSIYLKRCEEYMQKSPQNTWDGVYNLISK